MKVYGHDPYSDTARSELIRRSEQASVSMMEIKEIRFIGLDITRSGIKTIVNESAEL